MSRILHLKEIWVVGAFGIGTFYRKKIVARAVLRTFFGIIKANIIVIFCGKKLKKNRLSQNLLQQIIINNRIIDPNRQ